MLRIRTLSLSAAALALSTASVLAADLTYEPAPAAMAAPVGFSWTGPYVGAIVGYGWGDATAHHTFYNNSVNTDGAQIGVYGGYNFDLGNQIVVGAEADVNWADTTGYNAPDRFKENWDSTVRARAGYSFGRVMAYGTGGIAFAGGKVETAAGDDSNAHVGWTVGAGVEAAVTNNITARLEYQYADYGKETYNIGATSTPVDFNTNVIRAGVGYKF
ncbi:porin family protein [Kaistia dalseonensis]|uniref:Outer membrane immunogenic protein n=1 Tax=Kaistia dalseonensis TaxID=410840 RepID=A0ABU0H0G7_9HYPH|nr:outer membrane protein [Kaistia dalseonensis]MCX5493240.1 porin family protein [Kaistia dalseonensis]MDQ0435795.1 outer membrane immunogenic protein [Kaistia dalseonensis]